MGCFYFIFSCDLINLERRERQIKMNYRILLLKINK